MSFWNRIFGRKKERREPEKEQLEGPALVGTNVLDIGPWKGWKPEPPEEKRLGNLAVWSLKTIITGGREPMAIDRVGGYIYCGYSLYRFDFEGNPKGRLCLEKGPYGGFAVSRDGKLLVSRGSWLYQVDMEGQVTSAVRSGWFKSIDVLPDGTIVGAREYREGGIEKTILGFVQGGKLHEVDVSTIMVYGHDVRSSPDGFLYIVGGPASTTFVGNTVFKLDPAGQLVNSCSIFKNIGAICPTHDGGIDVVEMDGSRLVRLSREMKVVYDSQSDSRPEASLLFNPQLLGYVQAMGVDDSGNCYVLARGVLTRFKRFWEEAAVPESNKSAKSFVNAMFVFNSDQISDKVSSLYGAYAQGELLKALSRGLEPLGGWETCPPVMLCCNGDLFEESPPSLTVLSSWIKMGLHGIDVKNLDPDMVKNVKANQRLEYIPYVVGIGSIQGSYARMAHNELKAKEIIGYLGLFTLTGVDIPQLEGLLYLPQNMKIAVRKCIGGMAGIDDLREAGLEKG